MPILSTSHVPLSKIRTDNLRSNHNYNLVEEVANLILQGDGLISPLVLMQESTLIHYKLIGGFLEYHAAMRAREINLEKAENVQAYIIGIDFEETRKKALESQVEKLKNSNSKNPSDSLPEAVNQALSNLESHFSTMSHEVAAKLENLSRSSDSFLKGVSTIEDQLSAIAPLVPKSKININDPNLTVKNLCNINGIGKKYAEAILNYRDKNGGKFRSLSELSKVPGLTSGKVKPWITIGAVLVCEDAS